MIRQRFYKSMIGSGVVATQYIPLPPHQPELLECPCCGGRPTYKSLHAIWAECTVCGLSTPAYVDIDLVARAWNGAIQAVETGSTDNPDRVTAVPTDTDRSTFSRDGAYNGLLTAEEIDEALRLKQSRAEGKPILVKARKKKKRKVGRPMKGKTYAPKYVPTGRPPGRPRKYPVVVETEDDSQN